MSVINLGLCVHRLNVKIRPGLDVIFQCGRFGLQALAEKRAELEADNHAINYTVFGVHLR